MTTQTPTDIAAGLDLAADKALAPLSGAMTTDAPSGARTAHSAFVGALNELRAQAANGNAGIVAMQKEAATHYTNGLTEASKAATQRADAAKLALTTTLKDIVGKANLNLSVVEAECKLSLCPPVSTDPAARQLARSEIDGQTAGLSGAGLALALSHLVGQSVELDAELMSDWTTRKITTAAAGPREAGDALHAFQVIAIAKLGTVQPPRSGMTAAAVRILEAVPQARGSIAAIASSSAISAGLA